MKLWLQNSQALLHKQNLKHQMPQQSKKYFLFDTYISVRCLN